MRKRIEAFRTQFQLLPRALRMVWAATGAWSVFWLMLLVLQGLLPTASVYLIKLLIDSLSPLLASAAGGAELADLMNWETLREPVTYGIALGTVLLSIELAKHLVTWIRIAQAEYVSDHMSQIIHEKAVAVDLAYYESPEYYDQLHRVQSEVKNRPLNLLENLGGMLQQSVTLISMAALLLTYGAWLPLVLIVSALPALVVVLRYNLRYHRWWEEQTEKRRWTQYYDMMLTHNFVAKEVRLFDLGGMFRDSFQGLRHQLRKERLVMERQHVISKLSAALMAFLATAAVMAWMGWRGLQGAITLGDLALFYQAFSQGQVVVGGLMGNVGKVYNNSLFIGNLFEFMELEPGVVTPPEPKSLPVQLQQGIRFKNVDFRYPGSERKALSGFDLEIPAGKTVAIVGANGAGKSTLLRLLCRLYDPSAGHIEFDGIDLRDVSVEELHRRITVLFQFPVRYQATAASQIALSDASVEDDRDRIVASAVGAGADGFIQQLAHGYDTMLGRWFKGGTDLSGGQWQRLAMARAYLRQAQILILDEPTSHMDSWAELAWFERFQDLREGTTNVIITHRFTIAMRAEVIHVMDEGRVIESGSHAELLQQGGLYAQSWTAQMQEHTGSDGAGPAQEPEPPVPAWNEA